MARSPSSSFESARSLHACQHRRRRVERRLSRLHHRHGARHGRLRRRAGRFRISADAGAQRSVARDVDRRRVVRRRAADARVVRSIAPCGERGRPDARTAQAVDARSTPSAAHSDRSAWPELLARRSRRSLLLHPGRRRLFPPRATGDPERASHGLHSGLGPLRAPSISSGRAVRRRRRLASTSCWPSSRDGVHVFAATS